MTDILQPEQTPWAPLLLTQSQSQSQASRASRGPSLGEGTEETPRLQVLHRKRSVQDMPEGTEPSGGQPQSQGAACTRPTALTVLHHVLGCPPVCFFQPSLRHLRKAGSGSLGGDLGLPASATPFPGLKSHPPQPQPQGPGAMSYLWLPLQISLPLGTQKVEDLSRDHS